MCLSTSAPCHLAPPSLPPPTSPHAQVAPATWPFYAEVQGDAATRGLVHRLAALRDEAGRLAAEFVDAAQALKEAKKAFRAKVRLSSRPLCGPYLGPYLAPTSPSGPR